MDGDDLRREPLDVRKATLASVLTEAGPGLRLNEHLAAHILAAKPAKFDPRKFKDEYEKALKKLVRRKAKGARDIVK